MDTGREASHLLRTCGFLSPLLHATWADKHSVQSADRVPHTVNVTLGKEQSLGAPPHPTPP